METRETPESKKEIFWENLQSLVRGHAKIILNALKNKNLKELKQALLGLKDDTRRALVLLVSRDHGEIEWDGNFDLNEAD